MCAAKPISSVSGQNSRMGITFVQIMLAGALGAVIGVEREFGAQPAGLRTHMLVCLGAALFTLVGADLHQGDPARIAAQIVTGVGFLGGGAIFKEGVNIRGLTTAGSLWVTAAIGLAVGLRAWAAAIATTALAMGVLWLVKLAERDWLPRRHVVEIVLHVTPGTPLDQVEPAAIAIMPRAVTRHIGYAEHEQSLTFMTRPEVDASLSSLAERLLHVPGVQGVDIAR